MASLFLLNFVATILTTITDGDGDKGSNIINRTFPFNRDLMLTEDHVRPRVQDMLSKMRIPMHDSIFRKVMEMARVVADESRMRVFLGGLPFVTICVTVDDGVVTIVIGEFDLKKDDEKKED